MFKNETKVMDCKQIFEQLRVAMCDWLMYKLVQTEYMSFCCVVKSE